MDTSPQRPDLLVVTGPTASGKSGLALRLAQALDGELICADARTVYKDMVIGTAKPTSEEQQLVRHHLLDVVTPDLRYTVADFKRMAEAAITDVRSRGKLPIVVGGTGLYIDALIYDYRFEAAGEGPAAASSDGHSATADTTTNATALEAMDLSALHGLARERGIAAAVPPGTWQNPRHLRRFIARGGAGRKGRDEPAPGTVLVGIDPPAARLQTRITQRVDAMLAAGLEAEVRRLAPRYGWDAPAMSGIGYAQWRPFLAPAPQPVRTEHESGETTNLARGGMPPNLPPLTPDDIAAVRQAIISSTRQYAKRQHTWLRRNRRIQWFPDADAAYASVVQSA